MNNTHATQSAEALGKQRSRQEGGRMPPHVQTSQPTRGMSGKPWALQLTFAAFEFAAVSDYLATRPKSCVSRQ